MIYDDIGAGKVASIGALVTLYLQHNNLINNIIILMICGFGLIFSFTIGIIFSFNTWLPPFILALFIFGLQYSLSRLKLTHPPGNIFFIMAASVAISQHHSYSQIASSIGSFSIGVMITARWGYFIVYWCYGRKAKSLIGSSFRRVPM